MTWASSESLPRLQRLPASMPDEGAIDIALEEGIPVFRASRKIQERIRVLVDKQLAGTMTAAETEELDCFEDIDDYLSHLNRVVRNLALAAAA